MYTDSNFLINHAYKHVWCAPGQDRQHILSPSRLTTSSGAKWSVRIGMSHYNLPTKTDVYDVFMIGDVLPQSLGMLTVQETWVNAVNHSRNSSLLFDFYTKHGVHHPIANVWFLYTKSGGLVLAIQRTPNVPNFGKEALYVRWRSAAYYRLENIAYPYKVETGELVYSGNNSSYLNFREEWLLAKARPEGMALAYLNGYRVRDYSVAKLRAGDRLEWVWCADIKERIEIPYRSLLSFESELDDAVKFLIPRPGLGEEIDFLDDVDFYILNYTKPAEYTGIYYHLNRQDAARMVTHRDYALMTHYVNSAILDQKWTLGDDIRIEVIVRHSGFNRSLVDEHHRIKELYKLEEPARLAAMIGSDSGVDVWQAAELENSSYLKLMKAPIGTITDADVIDAYGYNTVSRLTGLVPIEVPAGVKYVDLFYGQFVESTVYEYDLDGRLIGWYNHQRQRQYALRNDNTRFIEAYAGRGGVGLSTVYNSHKQYEPFYLDNRRNYRFYVGTEQIDGETGQWQDVTGNEDYYTVAVDNRVVWKQLPTDAITAIRNDLDFLSKDIELPSDDGVLLFTVGTTEVYPGRSDMYTIMDVPPGEYDVMLNGYDLVEGIDYFCQWPEFCIVTANYRDNTRSSQTVTIRARGFCKPDFQFDQPGDRGFVIHNQLSRNGKFNVRDDRVTRVSIGGVLYTYDELGFAEDGTFINTVPNGTPYRITHPYVPMLDLVPGDTYDYREESMVVDEQIQGYMDVYNPEPEITVPNPIPSRYPLISPFCSKILEDLRSGFITSTEFEGNFGHQDIANRFVGYSYLLPYDPTLKELDDNLFTYLPHRHANVELDLYQFRIMKEVIRTFLNDKIELERYVTIIARE